MRRAREYDVIIIGAGIGGVVCGCYLAKAGKKVLIMERTQSPGGYCKSFRKSGLTFDACVHSLESLRPEGYLGRLFRDLQIEREDVLRNNPSNIVITPNHKVFIWNDLNKTISGLQAQFPLESANIEKFILSITQGSIYQLYRKIGVRTYSDVLEENFSSHELKEIFKMFLGCLYEPSYDISAFTAISAIREYVFDGGYYMRGGVGSLANVLTKKFKQFGGDMMLGSPVDEIVLRGKTVEGVRLKDDGTFRSKIVVSNCGVSQTFFNLIGKDQQDKDFIKKVSSVIVSKSALIVYLGLKQKRCDMDSFHYTNSMNVDEIFASKEPSFSRIYVICSSPTNYEKSTKDGKQSIVLFSGVPYMNKTYWSQNKKRYAENLIRNVEAVIGPIREDVGYEGISSPITLQNFTCNQGGAFRGWAPIMSQDKLALPINNIFKGLLFVGHWSTNIGRGGLPAVVFSGKSVAERVIEKL